ncbi:hypothetical protein RNJ44_01295 [Nakaseomyces bracarensis]|uniref:Uncharacterized protein n=1 Tax=Nakaseomyces bracarensis TaxID=273131 RepID=A0ABR4NRF6_9SACH
MDDEFGPIRKSIRQVGPASILQGHSDPEKIPQFDIYPVSKKRKPNDKKEFPFAVINYPCTTVSPELFYEHLEFKKFRYYLLSNVVSQAIDHLPALNRVSEVVYKLIVRALDKNSGLDGYTRNFHLHLPQCFNSSKLVIIDRPIVIFDTVCSPSYSLLVLKLHDIGSVDQKVWDDITRVLKFTYPRIIELISNYKDENQNFNSLLELLEQLNDNKPANVKKISLNIVLLKPNSECNLTREYKVNIVVLNITSKLTKDNGPDLTDIISHGNFNIAKLFSDIFLLEPSKTVPPNLLSKWNTLVKLQVPASNIKAQTGALFHKFLLSYTIGGLGYNFIYFLENILNEARDVNTLFHSLYLLDICE